MNLKLPSRSMLKTLTNLVALLGLFLPVASAMAQQSDTDPQPHASHSSPANSASKSDSSLVAELRELQAKVAMLEAALKQNHKAPMADATGYKSNLGHDDKMKMGGMQGGSMQDKGAMNRGMMGQMGMIPGISSMQSGQGMAGMGMMDEMGMGRMSMTSGKRGMSGQNTGSMGMDGMKMMGGMMGEMQGLGSMQLTSTLPGFPGASHIYHIGATNLFLDHPQHITLSQEQQTKLNQIKEQTLLGQATFDRWIDAGEQELWVLTSADAPDASKIEAKVGEIEKLRGDKRLAYIRAVGQAANVLTSEQRQTLVGLLPPDHAANAGAQH